MVRFIFNNFTFLYSDSLSVYFSVLVKLNPPLSIENIGYLGNPGDSTTVAGTTNRYLDVLDLDGDGITDEYLRTSEPLNLVTLVTNDYSITKGVKGENYSSFSASSYAYPGGSAEYEINVTNNQELTLTNLEIIDIFPHVGDTGVILIDEQRGSQFNLYASSYPVAEIINLMGEPVVPTPILNIEYSTSYDPIRYDILGTGLIGTGVWTTTPPEDITTLASVKVTTGPGTNLRSYESLRVRFKVTVPVGTLSGRTAYNSYAVKAYEIIAGNEELMLPVETAKVSLKTLALYKGAIGNLVWEDIEGDGIYNFEDPGINGVTVELYDTDNNLIKSTITVNNSNGDPGYYDFIQLDDGDYIVRFIPLDEFELTVQNTTNPNGSRPNPSTGLTNIITIENGARLNDINAGMKLIRTTSSIGYFVWEDLNGNGIRDAGEPGVNGVTVNLLNNLGTMIDTMITDSYNDNPGYYLFEDVVPGEYQLEFIPPLGFTLTIQENIAANGSKPNQLTGLTNSFVLGADEDIMDMNAGVLDVRSKIGNFVWEDSNGDGIYQAGEEGVNGVVVHLLNELDAIIETTETVDDEDGNQGYYYFEDLLPGTYRVQFIPPTGYQLTVQEDTLINGSKPNQTTGITNDIVLTAGVDRLDIIAGLIDLRTTADIGHFVWLDENKDGIWQTNEPGMNGVVVELLDDTNNVIATTTTSDDYIGDPGYYEFVDLAPGSYQIRFTAPTNYLLTVQQASISNGSKPNPDTGLTDMITLVAGEDVFDMDAGLIANFPASIGGFAWDDVNRDGIYDMEEEKLNGVTVNLLDESENIIETTITQEDEYGHNGYYLFNNLQAANYIVQFIPLTYYNITIQNTVSPNGSKPNPVTGMTNIITLNSGENILHIDAGFIRTTANIGQFVWLDENRDGIWQEGEPRINGVTVLLLNEEGDVLYSTETNDNEDGAPGFYLFDNLEAGNYMVEFIPPSNYILTEQNLTAEYGSKPDNMTGLTNLITVVEGQNEYSINAGLLESLPGDIGGFVWNDENEDGVWQEGEPRINGVVVRLLDLLGNVLESTTTSNNELDEPGYYLFQNLDQGGYIVEVVAPVNYLYTLQQDRMVNGSRINPLTGRSNIIILNSDERILNIYAGLISCEEPPLIIAEDRCIVVGSTFNPLLGVSARDCMGEIVLTELNVITNTVNSDLAGIYEVTYEVTSLVNGLTSTATIQVTVCELGRIHQAVTDVIESVALEQTALSHIINAEGEKIQKALSLDLTLDEMIKVNDSVKDMISSVSRLEMILHSKLELFNQCGSLCKESCCED